MRFLLLWSESSKVPAALRLVALRSELETGASTSTNKVRRGSTSNG